MRPAETGSVGAAAICCFALAALTGVAATAAAEGLRPHEVVYQFLFRGISGGELQLTLKPDNGPDEWLYETRAFPNFLASFVVNPKSIERSWFKVTPAGVEPRRYLLDDGTGANENACDLTYDWSRGRVTGIARGQPLDLPVAPGTQDAMSIRAVVLVDLLAGREPREYEMLDGRELKRYVYSRIGTARLRTPIGDIDTVMFKSERKGADRHARTWQFWYAPSLGWLPVRAEQREDGKARMTLAVRSLKWLPMGPAAPPATARR